MTDYTLRRMHSPLDDITIKLGAEKPLYQYVKMAIQDIEIINTLKRYPIYKDMYAAAPEIHVGNWKWNPHPLSEDIQYRRRETGTKVATKTVGDMRLGILSFDMLAKARDKNKNIVSQIIHNEIYIPIEDERGRYLLDNVLYQEYQLVDKLLYPKGKDAFTFKSLLPVDIKYEPATETSIDGYIIDSKIGWVKVFTSMEPILSCFMHVAAPLSYLNVFPIVQFCDHISDDKDEYEYFKPIDSLDLYVKGYRKGIEEFDYVKSIILMSVYIIRKHKPETFDDLMDPVWWTYQLSYYDGMVEHRGACYQMHVARMLDTISAQILPIPEVDKRDMLSLLRYVLQTDFTGVNIYSFENKRIRLNEVISTIVTAEVSEKLKGMFKFGTLLKMKDMESYLKFRPNVILNKIHSLGTIHVIDFANDLDYFQFLRFTKRGPNSLGRMDKNKIKKSHRQLHPSEIGVIDLQEYGKDVGQSGMLSPYADTNILYDTNKNKYPSIKFELYKFIQKHFENPTLTFNCNTVEEYNAILDSLVTHTYLNLDYHIDKLVDKYNEENK